MNGNLGEVLRSLQADIERLACDLLGKPISRTRSELRFGKSGAISVAIVGHKRGSWNAFNQDGAGGGPLDLIRHVKGIDRKHAIEFARDWLRISRPTNGNGRAHSSGTAGGSAAAEKAARRDAILHSTVAAKGTPAELYLVECRGITASANKLPAIGWNPRAWSGPEGQFGAIVFRATDDAGRPQAVQQVYLTPTGEKAPIRCQKRTNGPLGGAAVRFTGDVNTGRVILAEGPETALSVWQATREDTWACLGVSNIGNAQIPEVTHIVIARDADASGSKADKAVFDAAERLVRLGYRVDIATPSRYADLEKSDFNDMLRREGAEAVSAAIASAKPFVASKPAPVPEHKPPTIYVKAGLRHEAADAGLAALHAAEAPFFQRDRSLVRVCMIKAKAASGEITPAPGVLDVSQAVLAYELGRAADWISFDRKGNERRIDPPKPVVEQIAAMSGRWPFPILAGVIGTQTLRSDGTLLVAEGYDESTGLVLLGAPKMRKIPKRQNRAHAERALALLDRLLDEFPFADAVSRSVALSMLITPVVRGAFKTAAPLHLSTAPQPGTGKSYLADLASMIAIGDRCAVVAAAPKPEETEKRLVGAALSGLPIIALDNCSETIQGDFLCQLVERSLLHLRPLGTSQTIRVANTFTVLANGNNATIAGDMVRRTVQCTLDANMEAPEVREFKADPASVIRRDRGAYVAACLTIVRTYVLAGSPGLLPQLPSYGSWSDLVRSPLVWLGRPDPILTMNTIRGTDPIRQARAAVFNAWATELQLGRGYQTKELIQMAEGDPGSLEGFCARPLLREALLEVARAHSGRDIDSRRLGHWLGKSKNTLADGHKLTCDESDKARPRWVLSGC